MKTSASPVRRVAIALLAAPMIIGGCGSQPAEDPGGAADPTQSAATPDPSERPPGQADPGGPDGDQNLPPDGIGHEVVWIEDTLYVVAAGSSSCPPTARSVEVVSETEWAIDVTPRVDKGEACTMDLAPHRSRIGVPPDADPDTDVTAIIVDGEERSEPIPVTIHDASAG